jgi:hypothetical protein
MLNILYLPTAPNTGEIRLSHMTDDRSAQACLFVQFS